MRKLAFTLALLGSPACAATWNVDPVTSRLTFTAEQAGERVSGSFPKFTSAIAFDEAAPEKGNIHITVDMGKLQVEGKDRLDALPTEDWFFVAKFPTAEFTSRSIKKTGAHHYEATGPLTIRGVSKDITLPFTLATKEKSTTATGSFTLSRKDYGVGQGRWASEEGVKNAVKVSYEIRATAQ